MLLPLDGSVYATLPQFRMAVLLLYRLLPNGYDPFPMAQTDGIEPPLAVLETAVLPLN